MKLIEFINQIQSSIGDPSGDKHTVGKVLQYINEEVAYVAGRFPEKSAFVWSTTSSGYYHTLDFTDLPVVKVISLMINGSPAERVRWETLRGRIGNEV